MIFGWFWNFCFLFLFEWKRYDAILRYKSRNLIRRKSNYKNYKIAPKPELKAIFSKSAHWLIF